MPSPGYSQLLQAELSDEAFVRSGLGLLESSFREMALLALADWAACDIAAGEMFLAVASLQRPSWGMWNGLLTALRNARKATLRNGDAAQRQRLEQARTLERVLTVLDQPIDAVLLPRLKPLAELTRTSLNARSKLGAVLAMPIGLRNRIAHDTPTDDDWWKSAAQALRPLIEFASAFEAVAPPQQPTDYPSPWFYAEGNQVLAFNGVERDFAVLYVGDNGVSRPVAERAQDVLLAFARLLGQSHTQERDFRKLLSKHAPEDIRGVMMGDWLLGPPVGEGGFAVVHVGRQLSTGRKVALKILRDGMESETVARFQQEAAFLSRFRHPNIVGVYGYGQETWTAPKAFSLSGEAWYDAFSKTAPVKTFIALEWIEGQTLEEVFRQTASGQSPWIDQRVLATWMIQASSALAAVHAAGLIHRDIKPHNLMVTAAEQGMLPGGDRGFSSSVAAATRPGLSQTFSGFSTGQIKLMDFGIARLQKAERTLVTESGRSLGTPAYMSPEQIRAADAESEVGPASDVYSLAATFYELFTHRRLFAHDTQTLEMVRTAKISGVRPTRPRIVVKGLPWEIETILLGGLEPEPADRYRSMEALARDVRHFLADEPIEYRRPSLARRARLVYRRNRTVSNLVIVFVMAGTVAGIAYVRSIRAEQQRTAIQRDIAVRNEGIANEQRQLASARERQSRLNLAGMMTGNGHVLLNKGDAAGALLWYTRALPLTADIPAEDRLARLRVGMTLRQLARPVNAWLYPLQPRQAVFAAAFDFDGRWIATAEAHARHPASKPASSGGGQPDDFAGGCRVLDARTGQTVMPVVEHDRFVFACGISDDRSRVYTLSADHAARVFDIATGRLVGQPIVHPDAVVAGGITPDGKRLMTFCIDQKARFWDVDTGAASGDAIAFDRPMLSVSLSKEGDRLLVATAAEAPAAVAGKAAPVEAHGEAIVRTFDARTGKPLASPVTVPNFYQAIFGVDAKTFCVSSGSGWARVYDTTTGTPATPPLAHAGPVVFAAYSLDGKRIATASGDKTARVWDAATGQAVSISMVHEVAPFALGFSRDGKRLATLSHDQMLRIWNADSGYPAGAPVPCMAPFVNGSFLENDEDQFVLVSQSGATTWDFGRSIDPGDVRIDTHHDASRGSFSPDGAKIVLCSATGHVQIRSSATGELTESPMECGGAVVAAGFSPDGQRIVVGSADHSASVWRVGAARIIAGRVEGESLGASRVEAANATEGATVSATTVPTFPPTSVPTSVPRSTPTQATLATTAPTSSPATDPVDPRLLVRVTHDDAVTAAVFSPDGRTFATASKDKTGRVWDAATGRPIGQPLRHDGAVNDIAFSPDGRRLVTAGQDDTARVWDAATGNAITPPLKHRGKVDHARFSPDGKTVVCPDMSGSVTLWNAESGQMASRMAYGSVTQDAVFSGDGRLVLAAGFNDNVKVFSTTQPSAPLAVVNSGDISAFARFAPSDSEIYVSSFSGRRLWDTTGGPIGPVLHHAPLAYGEFSRDGGRLLTTDDKVRIWDISPEARSAADLETLAPLLAGRTLDEKGVLTRLDFADFVTRLGEARKSQSAAFSATRP